MSRPTLARAEAGDPSVSVGIYVTLLFLFGMIDLIYQSAKTERLPKRVRDPKF